MKNIAVFVSGGGTDMQSVIDGIEKGKIKGKIVAVIASKQGIKALDRANKHNIPAYVFEKKNYLDSSIMYAEIIDVLKRNDVDLIVLAGYLGILTENIVSEYKGRIINVHPSLIPKYCGNGFYGLKVHQAVVDNKEKISGVTVHYVDEGTDTGKIIAQKRVPVIVTDTAETLAARVLIEEHKLLPKVVARICGGVCRNNKVIRIKKNR